MVDNLMLEKTITHHKGDIPAGRFWPFRLEVNVGASTRNDAKQRYHFDSAIA